MQKRIAFVLFFWFILLSVSFAQTVMQAEVDKTDSLVSPDENEVLPESESSKITL